MDFRWTDGRTKPWTCTSRPAHLAGATTKYFFFILPGMLCCRLHLICSSFKHSTQSLIASVYHQADLSLRCAHRSFRWFCHEAAHLQRILHEWYMKFIGIKQAFICSFIYYCYWKNKEFRSVCRLLKNGVRISGILQNGVRILRKFQFRGQNLGCKHSFWWKTCMIFK